jgi:hypothetical protein
VSLALALLVGTYLIADRKAEADRTQLAVAQAQLVQTVSANRDFQSQVAQQLAQLQAQNADLAKALQARQSVEVKLPAQNASLSASQVAQGLGQGATASGDTIVLPLPLGQLALTDMQLVPMLQTDKAQLTTELANETQSLQLEKDAHTSDVKALQAQIDVDKVELKAEKALARRSKLRWFAAGVVVGFVGRAFAKV